MEHLVAPTLSPTLKQIMNGNGHCNYLCLLVGFNWDNCPSNNRKVLKQIVVAELQPDETVDAVREARLLAKVVCVYMCVCL